MQLGTEVRHWTLTSASRTSTHPHIIICYIPSKANCCGEKRNHLFNRTCCYAASSFRRLSRLQRPHNLDKDWPLSECSLIFSTEIVRFSCFIVMVTYTEQFLGLNVHKISCNITLVSSDWFTVLARNTGIRGFNIHSISS